MTGTLQKTLQGMLESKHTNTEKFEEYWFNDIAFDKYAWAQIPPFYNAYYTDYDTTVSAISTPD